MKKIFLLSLAFIASVFCFAQGAHDFHITEVYIAHEGENDGFQDEYGAVDIVRG